MQRRLRRLGTVACLFLLLVATGCTNLQTEVVRKDVNNSTALTIGKLDGSYLIEDFSLDKGEEVHLPYQANVEKGTYKIQIKQKDKVAFEKEITQEETGDIELTVEQEGSYELLLFSEESAEKVAFTVQWP